MTTRREQETGSIWKRRDGFRGALTYLDPETKERKRTHFSGKTRREVEKKMLDARVLLAQHKPVIESGDTVRAAVHLWLTTSWSHLKPTTIQDKPDYSRMASPPTTCRRSDGNSRRSSTSLSSVESFDATWSAQFPHPERPHRKRTGSQAKRSPHSSTPQKVTGLNRCSRSLLTAAFARERLWHCAGRMSTRSKGKHRSAGPLPGSKENSHGKIQRRIPQFEESTSPTKQMTRSLKLERYRPTTKLLQVLGATSDTFSPQPAVNRSTRVTLYAASLASEAAPVSVTEIFTL